MTPEKLPYVMNLIEVLILRRAILQEGSYEAYKLLKYWNEQFLCFDYLYICGLFCFIAF